MPTSTAQRGSTQDNSSGVQVAQGNTEVTNSGVLQTVIEEGNKTTYAETGRTGLTTDDTGTTDLTSGGFGTSLADCGNALSVYMRAACSVASATLTGFLVFYDGSGAPIAMSTTYSFTSDATKTIAGSGQKFPCVKQMTDCGAARQCKFYVLTVSAGTWNVYVRPI
jgi:hypothetical protein